jgi:hypothetical protein
MPSQPPPDLRLIGIRKYFSLWTSRTKYDPIKFQRHKSAVGRTVLEYPADGRLKAENDFHVIDLPRESCGAMCSSTACYSRRVLTCPALELSSHPCASNRSNDVPSNLVSLILSSVFNTTAIVNLLFRLIYFR